jgi:hypothetical protein
VKPSAIPDVLPANTPAIPDVVPAADAPVDVLPVGKRELATVLPVVPLVVQPVRKQPDLGKVLLGWVRAFLGWCWRVPVGALFCMNYFTSILVVGWSYRWVQGVVLWSWWRASRVKGDGSFAEFCAALGPDAPAVRPRWFLQEHIVAAINRPAPSGQRPSQFRMALRALQVPWHSLWRNFKVGLQALFCTYLLTGWGCLLMLFSWEFGWLNSFNKGYEQSFIGPATGFLGIFLFIAAMFYVPMAQVHQAVTGDFRAFFDFRFVWRLIQARLTAYVALAALIALASLPIEILKTAPLFMDGTAEWWTNLSDAEYGVSLRNFFLFCSFVLFPLLLFLRLVAALIYRSAVLKVLRRGWVTREELHPVLSGWLARLDLIPPAPPPMAAVERIVRSGGGWIYRWTCYGILFWIWFGFVAKTYVGEFFNYHPVVGFMNQLLVQFPCFDFIPAAVHPTPWLNGLLAFVVVCMLIGWAVFSAFSDHHPAEKASAR